MATKTILHKLRLLVDDCRAKSTTARGRGKKQARVPRKIARCSDALIAVWAGWRTMMDHNVC